MISRSSIAPYRNAPAAAGGRDRSAAMAERPQQTRPDRRLRRDRLHGPLVAAELQRRGADFVLAGRSAGKLEALASTLGGESPTGGGVARRRGRAARAARAVRGGDRVRGPVHPARRAGARAPRSRPARTTSTRPASSRSSPMVFDRYGDPAAAAGVIAGPGDGLRLRAGRHDRRADRRRAWGRSTSSRSPTRYAVRDDPGHHALGARIIGAGGDVEYRDGELRPARAGSTAARGSFPRRSAPSG